MPSVTQFIFFLLSAMAIASALYVVFYRNPAYNVLALIVTFFSIAGHYFLLNTPFLAAVHIIVYAGAIMVLFLYTIMMLNLSTDTEPNKPMLSKVAATITGGTLMIVLIASVHGAEMMQSPNKINDDIGLINNLGMVLYRDYALPFEVSAILFLAGMVGAVMLGKKEIQ